MNYKINFLKIKTVLLLSIFLIGCEVYGQEEMKMGEESSQLRTHEDKELQWGPCPDFMPVGCTIAVLHGDPSKKNVDIFFKVPPNYDIPAHYHSSAERMILVSGELQVTYEGEKEKIMKVGTYAYGPANKLHTAKCLGKDPCVLFIAFEEPLDAFPKVTKH
ncbi:cupin domain-containing protein [Arenibacter amylolyticus]|uniref:cupin domain-containing protein n=1 Tax=Arenibacter amylolyticus TaxID=1406873 RepID=UPI001FE62460|nr:cupin domain-containing protein [Arenibacter amylolyticus]